MKWAVAPDGLRVTATRGAPPHTCPSCGAAVHAKAGDLIENHWAHAIGEAAECELGEGLDADDFTGWHIALQTHAQHLGATIEATHPTAKRKADIRTSDGTVVELQHSRIDPDVVIGREADWMPLGSMLWLWDAAAWDIEPTRSADIHLLPGRPLIVGLARIFLDLASNGGVQMVTWCEPSRKGGRVAARLRPTGLDAFDFVECLATQRTAPWWFATRSTVDEEILLPAWRPTVDLEPSRPCPGPHRPGSFAGVQCGLTVAADSDFCWVHANLGQLAKGSVS